VHYSAGAIFASFDYITNDNGGDDDAWKLGGKYTMGDAAFYGSYERGALLFQSSNQLDAGNAGDDSANLWHLGASYSLGGTMAYFAYGRGDTKLGNANDQYRSWTLAVNHGFTKRTSAYGGFERLERDVDGKRDLFTVGMVHNF
jgi:predicted porin